MKQKLNCPINLVLYLLPIRSSFPSEDLFCDIRINMSTETNAIECKAAVLYAPRTDFVIETITVNPPKDDEVRIKMVAAGICFSDVHVQTGGFPWINYPLIGGHEATAVVESVGKDVTLFKTGDQVIPIWCYQCGECVDCKKGKRNVCLESIGFLMKCTLLDGTSRFKCKDRTVNHFLLVSAFSEYAVLPERALAKVDPTLDLKNMTPFGCCFMTGYGAVTKTAEVEEGSTVAVVGLGAVGLCALLGARDRKASKIIAVDVNPDKESFAFKFGATHFINPLNHSGKKTSDCVKELTGGVGADYVFPCVGNTVVLEDALNTARFGSGEVVIIGIQEEDIKIDTTQLIFGKTLKGTWGADCCCAKDIPDMLAMYKSGNLPTDLLVTHRIPLHLINYGFELLKEGKSIRTIIDF